MFPAALWIPNIRTGRFHVLKYNPDFSTTAITLRAALSRRDGAPCELLAWGTDA